MLLNTCRCWNVELASFNTIILLSKQIYILVYLNILSVSVLNSNKYLIQYNTIQMITLRNNCIAFCGILIS